MYAYFESKNAMVTALDAGERRLVSIQPGALGVALREAFGGLAEHRVENGVVTPARPASFRSDMFK